MVRRCLDWHRELPVLADRIVTLRELKASDAASLLEHLGNPAVLRYIAPPPVSIDGFQGFIRWTRLERKRRAQMCFGIVPADQPKPTGLIQLRPRDPSFSTAEWGFALAENYWGTGTFLAAAELLLDFAFNSLGLLRLEARAVAQNGRGNGVLRKLGATCEGTLRHGFRRGDAVMDDVMWSLLYEDWMNRAEGTKDGDEDNWAPDANLSGISPKLVRH
jgi:RimJ/RimL family protein N-acetyltransferase